MRVLVTRPEPESDALALTLRTLGHVPVQCPLIAVRFRDAPLDLEGVQAILFTSGAGVRAFARLSSRRDLPVFSVGDATAGSAREFGFMQVGSAGGDGSALVEYVATHAQPDAGALLHVSGLHVAGDIDSACALRGFAYRRVMLYEAVQAEALSEEGRSALKSGPLEAVLFFSPRTAEAFVSLVTKAGLVDRCRALTAFCLSDAVAAKAGALPWLAVRIAAEPNQQSLLALLPAGTFHP